MPFFRQFQHLLPDGNAWRITIDKTLRRFFEGLISAPSDARDYVDDVYDDVLPTTTRELEQWESQFGIPRGATDLIRRANIAAEWTATGGQSPSYIQGVLQLAGFNVFVHDWWELPFSSFAVTTVAAVAVTAVEIGSIVQDDIVGSRFTTAVNHEIGNQTVVHQSGFSESSYNGSFTAIVISPTVYEIVAILFAGNDTGSVGLRFTTSTPHGMTEPTLVRHTGFTESSYNGSFAVTVISTTVYAISEIPFAGDDSGTVQPYLYTVIDPRLYTNQPLIGAHQCSAFASQPQCTPAGISGQPVCNGLLANDTKYLVNDTLDNFPPPVVPDDPALWPYFIYIGAENFPDTEIVDTDRRQEFERLLLKLCPAHVWIVMRVDFVQDDDFFFGPGTKGWGESAWRQ